MSPAEPKIIICDNCEWQGPFCEVRSAIPDYHERVDADGPTPCGECPDCRFLVYDASVTKREAKKEQQHRQNENERKAWMSVQADLWILDALLTGKDPRDGRGYPENVIDIEKFLSGELWYLSDGGYSRVYFNEEHCLLLLSSESRKEVLECWEEHSVSQVLRRIQRSMREYVRQLTKIEAERVITERWEGHVNGLCNFRIAGVGPCEMRRPCGKHKDKKCVSCDKPATQECPETGQFVCGAPLCDDCEHFIVEEGHNGGVCPPSNPVDIRAWHVTKEENIHKIARARELES